MRVFVQKIAGGTPWALTIDSTSSEILPRWSPDNDELLFLARNSAFVSPALGGQPRLIARGTEGNGSVRSASWSPNGDSVAIVRNDSLFVQPLDVSGSRFVGRDDQLHSCVWSPDGRWIACVSGNWIALNPGTLFGNRAPSGLGLYPAEGGAAIELTDREQEHMSPAWSPDGRALWFLSNRDGVSGEVYSVPIGRDGHPDGPFTRAGPNAESISLSARRIAYSVPVRKQNIWALRIPTSGVETTAFLAWGKDPNILWFLGQDPRGRGGIWELRIRDGHARPLVRFDDPAGRSNGAAFTTDGKQFFFTLDERLSNVRWAELVSR